MENLVASYLRVGGLKLNWRGALEKKEGKWTSKKRAGNSPSSPSSRADGGSHTWSADRTGCTRRASGPEVVGRGQANGGARHLFWNSELDSDCKILKKQRIRQGK